jgi:hypothetical protein
MVINATAAGLWLIALGALLAALPRLLRPPRPELGLRWESMAERVSRLHFASESVGLILVAAGSVVIAFAEMGPWWFDAATVVVASLAVWFIAALKLRQLWKMRARNAMSGPPSPPLHATATANARWSVCLRRAFASTADWPPKPAGVAAPEARLKPRDVDELRERGARLEDAQIPPSVKRDVVLIREFGFDVRVVGDALVATAPDGRTAQVSRSGVSSNSGAVLHRQRWLDELEALGLSIRPGVRGQPQVAPAVKPSVDHPA